MVILCFYEMLHITGLLCRQVLDYMLGFVEFPGMPQVFLCV